MDSEAVVRILESLPIRERGEIRKSAHGKAVADLLPMERAYVQKVINDIRTIPKCGDGMATEIVAALGMFLDKEHERKSQRQKESPAER